ncbi:MAG: aldo/keto reductase [Actinomycetota bacterium]|nr:aldo/keto reductase [Actinomycetota bacterium]
MEIRRLGPLSVPAVGFGAMVLSPGFYGPIDDDQANRALMHAIDAGSSFVDTSDGYGRNAHNECLIGASIVGRRDDVVISTKFGYRVPAGVERHRFHVAYGTLAVNAEPQNIRGYAVASLARLRTDHIDLYSPHFPDPLVPIEDTVGAMGDLVSEGLVRHLGLSNVTADQLERAVAVHEISAVQCEWSLWAPADPELLAVAERHGIGVVAWSPLGGGFLTGTLAALDASDFRNNFPRLSGVNLAVNNDRFAPIKTLAGELELTPSQLALAWLLHQHPAVVPIPGSRTAAHITENAAAASIPLSAETLERIDDARELFRPEGGTILAVPATRPP